MQCMTRSFFSFPFLSFFSVSAYRTTVFQCILNSGVLVGGAVIFLEVLIKKKRRKKERNAPLGLCTAAKSLIGLL